MCKKKRLKPPANLGEAVVRVARMGGGGYLSRMHDPPPGHQLMWRGYAHLQLLCEGFSIRDG
ncbi:MAG: hypothetical protein HQ557_15735 [Bacteroidetes bacterium]|nr:hypothetical protein [Bacteroidota bacterium]